MIEEKHLMPTSCLYLQHLHICSFSLPLFKCEQSEYAEMEVKLAFVIQGTLITNVLTKRTQRRCCSSKVMQSKILAGSKDERDPEARNVKNAALGAGIGQESHSSSELVAGARPVDTLISAQ